MRVRGPNNVERAVQNGSHIVALRFGDLEQKKRWESCAQNCDRF